jgi:hypothetical protein
MSSSSTSRVYTPTDASPLPGLNLNPDLSSSPSRPMSDDDDEPELGPEMTATLDYTEADRFSQVPECDQHLLSKDDPRHFDSNDAEGNPYQGGQAGRESQQTPDPIADAYDPSDAAASGAEDEKKRARILYPSWITDVDRYVISACDPKEVEPYLAIREYQESTAVTKADLAAIAALNELAAPPAASASSSSSSSSSTTTDNDNNDNAGWQRNVRPRLEPPAPVAAPESKPMKYGTAVDVAKDVRIQWGSQGRSEEDLFRIFLQYLVWQQCRVPVAVYISKPINCELAALDLTPSTFYAKLNAVDGTDRVTLDITNPNIPEKITWTEKIGRTEITTRQWRYSSVYVISPLTAKPETAKLALRGDPPLRYSIERSFQCSCSRTRHLCTSKPQVVFELDLHGAFVSPLISDVLELCLQVRGNAGKYPLIDLVLDYFGGSLCSAGTVVEEA